MLIMIDLLTVCNDDVRISIFNEECDLIKRFDNRNDIPVGLSLNFIEWIHPVKENELNIGLAYTKK